MSTLRHSSRMAAVQVLASLLWQPHGDASERVRFVCQEISDPPLKKTAFCAELVKGVLLHREGLDQAISEHAPRIPVDKMEAVDRAILEMGLFELLHTETPPPVVINEAVEVAKCFGDDGSGRFINGVLASAWRQIQTAKKPAIAAKNA